MALLYQIALTSVWWNDDYKDVRRFNSALEQQNYFNLASLFEKAPLINFDIKDLMRPRIVFKEPNRDVFDVLNSNYLIVKDKHASSVQKYFYYFIDRIYQDSGDQYIAECKLDVWQTCQFSAHIGKGLVERAHLNRFIIDPDSEEKIYFDWSRSSPLMIEEKQVLENDKQLVLRHNLNSPYLANGSSIGTWLKDNVAGWLYVFIEGSKMYKSLKFNSETIPDTAPGEFYAFGAKAGKIELPYSILICPIYKGSKSIFLEDASGKRIRFMEDFSSFRKYNNEYSFVYSKKILPVNPLIKYFYIENSLMPDFAFELTSSEATIESSGLIIHTGATLTENSSYFTPPDRKISIFASGTKTSDYYRGTLYIGDASDLADIKNILKQVLVIPGRTKPLLTVKPFSDTIATLKNQFENKTLKKRVNLNPKIYGAAYYQIRLNIANQEAVSFGFNQLAIKKDSVDLTGPYFDNFFYARCSLVPEVETLGLCPYKSLFYYATYDYKASFGAVFTVDLSIPFKNSVYEQYIANNKNFWLQNKTAWAQKAFNTVISTATTPDYTAAGIKATQNFVGIGLDYFQTKYNLNNMQNAPDRYSAGSGSVNYAFSYEDEIAYYLDEYKVPDYIQQRDNDYMYLYGFKYGRIDDFENLNNIRAYFNYIQGNFESISGNLSDAARKILYDTLLAGVRFWNVDRSSFDFTLENLENSILQYDED